MNLKHLTDYTLLKDTKNLVNQEREITTTILHHIKEIETRKLYSDLKYPSLFEYCCKELGYNESSAFRRIAASRLLKEIPQIEEKIEQGTLNLTNLSKAAQFFKENEIVEIKAKKEIISQLENLSTRECEEKLNSLTGINEEKRVRLSIKETTYNSLLVVKGLFGKNHNFDELLGVLIKNSEEKIQKEKFKQNSSVRLLSAQKATRIISTGVKRKVYQRDKKCVQCGGTHFLNFDHRKPYALGGKSTIDNVRLLCFNCNQRSRIKAKL